MNRKHPTTNLLSVQALFYTSSNEYDRATAIFFIIIMLFFFFYFVNFFNFLIIFKNTNK